MRKNPRAAKPDKTSWRIGRKTATAGLIFALVLAAYSSVIAYGGFVWDDEPILTANPLIKAPDGLYRFWFDRETYSYLPDYLPMTWTSLWLEWRLWGDQPVGYHVTNIALHAVSAFLLYLVLVRLKIPGALLAAAIFAVHPVAVASVAWISERKNTLSMFFYLLAILEYLDYDDRRKISRYALAILLFALALLSKSSVVMTPLVLLGCVWWRRGRIVRRDLLAIAPMLVLSAVVVAVTIYSQETRAIGTASPRPEGFASRLAVAGMAPWFYLNKIILPINLSMIYPRWEVAGIRLVDFLPGIAMLAGLAVLIVFRKTVWGRPALFSMGYFVISLFPVLGFFRMSFASFSLVADHLQYLAMIGPIALIAGASWHWGTTLSAKMNRPMVAASACLLAFLSVLTWHQGLNFSSEGAFWQDIIRKNPNRSEAYYSLGLYFQRKDDRPHAIECYLKAISLSPGYAQAHNNLAVAYADTGQLDKAMQHIQLAVKYKPDYIEARCNLGQVLLMQGQYRQAKEQYAETLRTVPDCKRAMEGLVLLYSAAPDPSVRNSAAALDLAKKLNELTKNRDPVAMDYLAMAYAEHGDFEKAVELSQQACIMITKTNLKHLLPEMNKKLNIYRQNKPFRFTPSQSATSPSASAASPSK